MKLADCCGFARGLNFKRLIYTTLALFIFIVVSDCLIHGVILKGTYEATASLWRPQAEMQQTIGWMFLAQFVLAGSLTFIFARGYEGKGIAEGIRFGVLAGFFSIGHFLIQYAVTPLTCTVLMAWCAFGLAQAVLAGVIASFVYKH